MKVVTDNSITGTGTIDLNDVLGSFKTYVESLNRPSYFSLKTEVSLGDATYPVVGDRIFIPVSGLCDDVKHFKLMSVENLELEKTYGLANGTGTGRELYEFKVIDSSKPVFVHTCYESRDYYEYKNHKIHRLDLN